MLMPTRVNYRKSQRGRLKGCTKAGAFVRDGEAINPIPAATVAAIN